MRIVTCGPSKRPATNSTYARGNSHPSTSNLNESNSANSLNKSHYLARSGISNNGSMIQNVGLYGNTPMVYESEPNM